MISSPRSISDSASNMGLRNQVENPHPIDGHHIKCLDQVRNLNALAALLRHNPGHQTPQNVPDCDSTNISNALMCPKRTHGTSLCRVHFQQSEQVVCIHPDGPAAATMGRAQRLKEEIIIENETLFFLRVTNDESVTQFDAQNRSTEPDDDPLQRLMK